MEEDNNHLRAKLAIVEVLLNPLASLIVSNKLTAVRFIFYVIMEKENLEFVFLCLLHFFSTFPEEITSDLISSFLNRITTFKITDQASFSVSVLKDKVTAKLVKMIDNWTIISLLFLQTDPYTTFLSTLLVNSSFETKEVIDTSCNEQVKNSAILVLTEYIKATVAAGYLNQARSFISHVSNLVAKSFSLSTQDSIIRANLLHLLGECFCSFTIDDFGSVSFLQFLDILSSVLKNNEVEKRLFKEDAIDFANCIFEFVDNEVTY